MRQLLPTPVDQVDLRDVYGTVDRPRPDSRPWVVMTMVTSVDGATAVEGRSGHLGGPGDRQVFRALRDAADVIVVGAATVRAERYGPPRPTDVVRADRLQRGQAPAPRIAIVTRTVDLDWAMPLFAETEDPPIIVTTASADTSAAESAGVEVLVAGDTHVDPARALSALGGRALDMALLEGGPSLNGHFVAAGLIDEVCLTTSPQLVGGDAPRVCVGGAAVLDEVELVHLLEQDGTLFARYVRAARD